LKGLAIKAQPGRISLLPLVIIAIFACLPIALSAIGSVLAAVFECAGEIASVRCKVQSANSLVSTLISMAWLSIVSIPLGGVAALIWAVVVMVSSPKRHDR